MSTVDEIASSIKSRMFRPNNRAVRIFQAYVTFRIDGEVRNLEGSGLVSDLSWEKQETQENKDELARVFGESARQQIIDELIRLGSSGQELEVYRGGT